MHALRTVNGIALLFSYIRTLMMYYGSSCSLDRIAKSLCYKVFFLCVHVIQWSTGYGERLYCHILLCNT